MGVRDHASGYMYMGIWTYEATCRASIFGSEASVKLFYQSVVATIGEEL